MLSALIALAVAAPTSLPVQGTLADVGGAPLEGTRLVTFHLRDHATATGTFHWSQAVSVAFAGGAFSASLGAGDTLDTATFTDHPSLWLSVAVDGGPESPRVRLAPAPYAVSALDADALDGHPASDFALASPDSLDWSWIDPTTIPASTAGAGLDLNAGVFDVNATWVRDNALAVCPDTTPELRTLLDDAYVSPNETATLGALTTPALTVNGNASVTGTLTVNNLTVTGTTTGVSGGGGGGVGGGATVGANSAACDGALQGQLRLSGLNVELCNANAWMRLGTLTSGLDGLSQANAAASCQAIKTAYPTSTDGAYWIDPNGAPTTDAARVWCDMTTSGGGWTMVGIWSNSPDRREPWLTAGSPYTSHNDAIWYSGSAFGDCTSQGTNSAKCTTYAALSGTELMARERTFAGNIGQRSWTLAAAGTVESLFRSPPHPTHNSTNTGTVVTSASTSILSPADTGWALTGAATLRANYSLGNDGCRLAATTFSGETTSGLGCRVDHTWSFPIANTTDGGVGNVNTDWNDSAGYSDTRYGDSGHLGMVVWMFIR